MKSTTKTMLAKYAGTCQTCAKPITRGDLIYWSRYSGTRHANCHHNHNTAAAQVAPCWDCKDPNGRLRSYGAATPCLCDPCEAKRRHADAHRFDSQEDYHCSDRGYEDACAAACGPGL